MERGDDRFSRQAVAQAFGTTLRELRKARRLSQEYVAEIAGVHSTYLSLLERRLRTPTITAIVRLSDALGVTPEYLVKETMARLRLSERPDRIAVEMDSHTDKTTDAPES